MKEDFVTYELAVKLKEKGFNKPCIASYRGGKLSPHKKEILGESEYIDEDISVSYKSLLRDARESLGVIAPTISQVLKWLREEKKIYIIAEPFPSMATKDKVVWGWSFKHNSDGAYIDHTYSDCASYMTCEFAALAGIDYVVDNLI